MSNQTLDQRRAAIFKCFLLCKRHFLVVNHDLYNDFHFSNHIQMAKKRFTPYDILKHCGNVVNFREQNLS